MAAKTLMIQGTASSVGKSLLVTALCRILRQQGINVAPFKSQNMSLNSYVTEEGHEMGRAQVSQARAAGLEPSSLMNPLLLKPCSNRKSQVIVNGKVRCTLSAQEYFSCKEQFLPDVIKAFTTLSQRHDVIIIEGAGSPAEINLLENDFVNMGMADIANAPVLLAGDIDRGGVFASLYGTIKLLPKKHQQRIKGLIINKFRGDLSILAPGLSLLEKLVDIPFLGVLPFEKFAIDEEDSLTERFSASSTGGIRIVVPQFPRIANFTDFAVFDSLPNCSLTYIEEVNDLEGADLIILPGSKNTKEDLNWLVKTGLAQAICSAASKGTPLIGICGGFQMLGKVIHDPLGVESSSSSVQGLGLIDMETIFAEEKYTVRTTHEMLECTGLLHGTKGMHVTGYEIHMGRSVYGKNALPLARRYSDAVTSNKSSDDCNVSKATKASGKELVDNVDHEADLAATNSDALSGGITGAMNESGRIFGTYLHGIFDNLTFTRHLLSCISSEKKEQKQALTFGKGKEASHSLDTANQAIEHFHEDLSTHYSQMQEREYDRLAQMVESHLGMDAILRIINKGE